MPSLPLFPLGTALLPGARLPLQLFEPRYLVLARTLAEREEDDRRFGVTLIRKGHEVGPDSVQDLHAIGCEARVDAMALAEGQAGTVVHLVATGVRRFRLDGIDDAAGTPFTTGLVTWLPEPPAADDPAVVDLAARALREHATYLVALGRRRRPGGGAAVGRRLPDRRADGARPRRPAARARGGRCRHAAAHRAGPAAARDGDRRSVRCPADPARPGRRLAQLTRAGRGRDACGVGLDVRWQ